MTTTTSRARIVAFAAIVAVALLVAVAAVVLGAGGKTPVAASAVKMRHPAEICLSIWKQKS